MAISLQQYCTFMVECFQHLLSMIILLMGIVAELIHQNPYLISNMTHTNRNCENSGAGESKGRKPQ